MKLRNTRHKGLKALIENDDAKGIRADQVKRARNILAALRYAATMDEVSGPPGWRIHRSWATAPERGAFLFPATGALRSRSRTAKFPTWIWRIITDDRHP